VTQVLPWLQHNHNKLLIVTYLSKRTAKLGLRLSDRAVSCCFSWSLVLSVTSVNVLVDKK